MYAEFDGNDNLIVLAKDTSSDMNIEKGMWWRMGKSFGAEAGLGEMIEIGRASCRERV